ncbi:hypothetical protein LGM43_31635 [Burkholderia seminalis]|uniref:hypothetical protein n=1 Tax=Burkholderia seminalis TaxID=488731 RepID=UPI001CF30D75|nr:hypothetical protein [Burkholderia seminalis]MCA7954818.1 hypothetical protein [Burkholderia seminalis]
MAAPETLVAAWSCIEAFNHLTIYFADERPCDGPRACAFAAKKGAGLRQRTVNAGAV